MANETVRTRVILVDDHPVVRQGLADLLRQAGFDVVAQTATSEDAITALRENEADALVVDLTLEHGSGAEVMKAARKYRPSLPMVVYSVHEDGDKVRQAMQAGAMGYVTKREDPDVLLEALQRHEDR
jgi:DNA-binding NarL/FixJ family response regulator